MKVEIDTKVLLKYNITAEQFILLNSIHSLDYTALDYIDLNSVQSSLNIKYLSDNNFLLDMSGKNEVNFSNILLKIKSINLLSLKKNKTIIKKEVSSWIHEYREIFPKGLNFNNHPYRGNKQGCIDKMINFIIKNPEFNKNLILKATKHYVDEKSKVNYDYMSEAHYFIEKNGGSPMQGLCEWFLEGGESSSTNNNERKVFNI